MKGRFGIILVICVALLGGCAFGGVGHFKPEEYNIECLRVSRVWFNDRKEYSDTIYFEDDRSVSVNDGSLYEIGKKYLVIASKSHRNYLIPYEQIYRDIRFPPPPPTECGK